MENTNPENVTEVCETVTLPNEVQTAERDEFARRHPGIDPDSLFLDPDFASYAYGKEGKVSLADIYDGYEKLLAKCELSAKASLAQAMANARATPGKLGGTSSREGLFSRADVAAMSPADVHRHYDRIRESMRAWEE